ncbi:MAG: chlorophyll synthesis pathway protein BchC [Caldimonas sp.]
MSFTNRPTHLVQGSEWLNANDHALDPMNALAVVLTNPMDLALQRLPLSMPTEDDVVVDIEWSGISTGTERLLWAGRMPHFPGMGYPLVPGYESVGRVARAGKRSGRRHGERVFVPGAKCFGDVRGLFGGAASRVVLPGVRALPIDEAIGERGVLLALAATAFHATSGEGGRLPDLIIGHGVLGRLLARLAVAAGAAPVVWELDPSRRAGASGYAVVDPAEDSRRDYRCIVDVSGDAGGLDGLIARLAPGGEVVLAGFYDVPLSFAFAPAFMREARLRVAAQWQPADLVAVRDMAASGRLSLDGLITHRMAADKADAAYRTAFGDAGCLKMVLDWRDNP